MAKYVIKDPFVSIEDDSNAAQDMSGWIRSVSFTQVAGEVDATAFGDDNIVRLGGLQDGSIDIDWQQDFDQTDDPPFKVLNDLLGKTTEIVVRPTAAAASATNPEKSVDVLITEVPFIDGSIGELSTFSTSWPFSGAVTDNP